MTKKTRVLIVDDSALMRSLLKATLGADPDIEVVGAAQDPYVGREMLVKHRPDVMTLDLQMPRMDGISFLEKVMAHMPTRTLVVSGITQAGSASALAALAAGAIDVVGKPEAANSAELARWGEALAARVKAVAGARLPGPPAPSAPAPADAKAGASSARRGAAPAQVIAIAASTGGTEALKVLLSGLPAGLPPIVIVQHMPALFTKGFTEQLAKLCKFPVREAINGERLAAGTAILAPGDFHLELTGRGPFPGVRLHQAATLHGVRPAADYLFRSVAKIFGAKALGVVLTGMGRDGAEGLTEMRQLGAWTIAQSEATCVVYGMPKAAVEAGGISRILDLPAIAGAVRERAA